MNSNQSHEPDDCEAGAVEPVRRISDDRASESTVAAWEMIESGRYMPRRIRGSFPGRELG